MRPWWRPKSRSNDGSGAVGRVESPLGLSSQLGFGLYSSERPVVHVHIQFVHGRAAAPVGDSRPPFGLRRCPRILFILNPMLKPRRHVLCSENVGICDTGQKVARRLPSWLRLRPKPSGRPRHAVTSRKESNRHVAYPACEIARCAESAKKKRQTAPLTFWRRVPWGR